MTDKKIDLPEARRLSEKAGILIETNSEGEDGTLPAECIESVNAYLDDALGSYSERGKLSGKERSREDEMFTFLDRLAVSDEVEPSEYAAKLQAAKNIGQSQAYEYIQRWRNRGHSGEHT